MTRPAYLEKLKDPRWQKTRLQVFERDKWACQGCFDTDTTLHCHHRYYLPEKEPWEYPIEAFITLCADCHDAETQEMESVCKSLISELKKKFLYDDILTLAAAVHDMKLQSNQSVIASAYAHAIENKTMQKIIIEKYFEKIEKNNGKSSV